MMFEQFLRILPRDPEEDVGSFGDPSVPNIVGLQELLGSFGGASFAGGLYRIVRPKDLEMWQLRVESAFPQFEKRIVCFGYDWLGSAFALDPNRLVGAQPGVVMFEPGTGKALEMPSNILSFHNLGLKEFGEAALAIGFFQRWLSIGGRAPSTMQCVGYKKPLFLGGNDDVTNLELSDIDVYWHVMARLIRRTRGLPEGTPIHTDIG
jgi:hypothetical protein